MVKPLTIQTNLNANVASLTLACFRLTSSQKTATMQLLKPIQEWGEGNLFWKTLGSNCHPAGKPPPPDAVKPRSLLAAAPLLAHVEQLTKSDQCLTSLTSNLPQVKIYFHSILTFLYSRIWMNQAEKLKDLKLQWQMLNLQNVVARMGPPTAACLHYCPGWEQVGRNRNSP